MSDTSGAAPAAPGGGELSIAQAVNILGQPPKPKPDEPATPRPPPPPPARPGDRPGDRPPDQVGGQDQPDAPSPGQAEGQEAPPDGDDAEPDEAPGDEPEAEDEAEEPPVKPPRTWTTAEKEAFASLPREHQEAIVARENERDAYYQRGLQEAASKARAARAREQAAEQARVQYEAALPQLFQQFSAQFQTEFQDIKTWDDVSNMRQNDPMRFMAWQEAREKGQTLQKEAWQAQERQQQEQSQRYQAYQSAESAKVEAYLAKEHARLGSAKDVGDKVRAVMIDHYGMTDEELSGWWHNATPMYLADSRIQQMAIDAYAYRNARKAATEATRKPVPPVQRPGTATNRGEAANVSIKILDQKLSKTGRIEDAVALLNARSRSARR